MFFYISLFIAGVIIAFVVLYVYRSLWEVGQTIYRAFLPLATAIKDTPAPWGWDGHASPDSVKRPHAVRQKGQTPWGWPGNDQEIREHGTGNGLLNSLRNLHDGVSATGAERNPSVGWPSREEQFEFAGKTYKTTRKATPERPNRKTSGKPWGW